MKLDEIAGAVEVDPSAAARFLRGWYDEDDLVTLVGVRKKEPQKPHLMAEVYPVEELVVGLESDGGQQLLHSLVNDPRDGSQWNLYVQVCPAAHELESPFKRGGDENVARFWGPWVDLDVKPGSFETQDDALNFLRGLDVFPTTVVTTGSGGVHAYWRMTHSLAVEAGRDLVRAWWSYLGEKASSYGAKVDHLVDISRMMRLPGTVRWPKEREAAVPALVSLFYVGGPETHVAPERLLEVASPASERREERIRRTQLTDRQRRWDADSIAAELLNSENRWSTLRAVAQVEDLFNELVSWDEILEPEGWTFLREDNNERREWARPGRGDKSATTDWPESPHVMSLLSSSEDTGLADLKEAEIALTKYRVALRYWFNDDETEMVKWTISRAGG